MAFVWYASSVIFTIERNLIYNNFIVFIGRASTRSVQQVVVFLLQFGSQFTKCIAIMARFIEVAHLRSSIRIWLVSDFSQYLSYSTFKLCINFDPLLRVFISCIEGLHVVNHSQMSIYSLSINNTRKVYNIKVIIKQQSRTR